MEITTPEQWWEAVNAHWENLLSAVRAFHPSSKLVEQAQAVMPIELELPITAGNAESCLRPIREEIAVEELGLASPADRLIKAKEEKDWATANSIFSATWFGVPESLGCWDIPSFGVLCDLCSEAWVFEEEEESHGA